jgi:hypothetical protein
MSNTGRCGGRRECEGKVALGSIDRFGLICYYAQHDAEEITKLDKSEVNYRLLYV